MFLYSYSAESITVSKVAQERGQERIREGNGKRGRKKEQRGIRERWWREKV